MLLKAPSVMSPRGEEEERKLTGNLEEAVRIVGIQLGHVIHGLNVEIPITCNVSPRTNSSYPTSPCGWNIQWLICIGQRGSLSLLPLRPRFDQVINILSQRYSSTRSDGNTNDGDVCRALCE